jgi:hypothetical protein
MKMGFDNPYIQTLDWSEINTDFLQSTESEMKMNLPFDPDILEINFRKKTAKYGNIYVKDILQIVKI